MCRTRGQGESVFRCSSQLDFGGHLADGRWQGRWRLSHGSSWRLVGSVQFIEAQRDADRQRGL
jgi:hypothetical protein